MSTTWILVAERSRATVYEHQPETAGLTVKQTISNPDGRLESHDIGADRKGRSFDGHGVVGSALEPQHTPAENVADHFAHHLAETLREGRNLHAFERLVMVAEPKFLGRLRGQLDHATASTVVGSLDKDLTHATRGDLEQQVAHLLNPA